MSESPQWSRALVMRSKSSGLQKSTAISPFRIRPIGHATTFAKYGILASILIKSIRKYAQLVAIARAHGSQDILHRPRILKR